ncbi:probable phosphatase PSR2 isoform X1 [Selaginella moellendorffii]|uniref:probable phosphatase PSR2 isoform X1 n=2 Tax=Selaginella moellendorffii TaxID=88036 RepID=UPI000D1CAFC5|nr:probable phosphatase PSR2 isoform X1 [Selaginella moellendorffii]|eukprot:XP_024521892.1 probable phosphatase PSR2 isoform X1 [Selaginella moellendorffii]
MDALRSLHEGRILRALWQTCVYGAVLLLRMILRVLDASQLPLRRFLCFLSIHALCEPSSPCCELLPGWKNPLLPPRIGRSDQELTVILDLDETLVCAYDSAGLPPGLHSRAVNTGMTWFQLECLAADKDKEGNVKINCVMVYERPGLREFLARASQFAELVLFTAGLEGYARPLVDRIDPENRISARLYRPATLVTKYREHIKDLSRLGRDLRRTVIIDNNPCSFILQPSNGIPCVPFTAENPNDSQVCRTSSSFLVIDFLLASCVVVARRASPAAGTASSTRGRATHSERSI